MDDDRALTRCPEDEVLVEFALGGLSKRDAEQVESHAVHCSVCRKALAALASGTCLEPVSPRTVEGPYSSQGQQESRSSSGSSVAPETVIDGYVVIRRLGQGGMGDVYLARDSQLGRKIALKIIRAEALGSKDAVERFLQEARITALFSHPHIVAIHAVGTYEGRPYLALEYVEGQTLEERLREDALGFQQALRIALPIAGALAEAHRHGVLHRDLKPANILIGKDGRLRVADFGLAKGAKGNDVGTLGDYGGFAQTGPQSDCALRGTPRYMAPEQWEGECSAATDLWAFGLVLWELLGGAFPFALKSLSTLQAQICSPEAVPLDTPSAIHNPELAELVRRCLNKSAGLRPSAEEVLQSLERLLRPGSGSSTIDPAPFRGLLPFTEEHEALFFGRSSEVAIFLERLRQEPVLAIVGPSGAGKSSFVQAGVVPRLRDQGPVVVLALRPGRHPLETLANRLRVGESWSSSGGLGTGVPLSAAEWVKSQDLGRELRDCPGRLAVQLEELASRRRARVVLLIDQLEELHTLVEQEQERSAFLEAVCRAADDPAGPVRVVLTLRDDFLGRIAQGPVAREALRHIMLLRTPGPPELAEVLAGPVRALGYDYEDPDLVSEMVASVQGEGSALPLLQFVGQALWDRRDSQRRMLTRCAYEEVQGVAGALAYHADGVIDSLPAEQVQCARELLLRLVTPEQTRRVLGRAELLDGLGREAETVLDRLSQARLLLVHRGRGDATTTNVELVHESLAIHWDRFARWIQESREDLAFEAQARQAAELWKSRGRRDEEVWEGSALQEALRRKQAHPQRNDTVREFLAAGLKKERKRVLRRRAGLALSFVVLACIAATAVVVAVVVNNQKNEVRRQKAQVERRRAESVREGAEAALARDDPLAARAKLRVALEADDSLQARALWGRLKAQPLVWAREVLSAVNEVTFSPDGKTVAAACDGGHVYLIDADTAQTRLLSGPTDNLNAAAFSPKGWLLATAGQGGQIALWSAPTASAWFLNPSGPSVEVLAFSPNGDILASGHSDGTIVLWDPEKRTRRTEIRQQPGDANSLAFAPQGTTLASSGHGPAVTLWDASTGREKFSLAALPSISRLAFHPNGNRLVASSVNGTLQVWDLPSRTLLDSLQGIRSVRSLAFNPDGAVVATAGYQEGIQFRDPQNHLRKIKRFLLDPGSVVHGVAFAPNSNRLVSGGTDRFVRLWDASYPPGDELSVGHPSLINALVFSADEQLLFTGGRERTTRVWEVASGRVLRAVQDQSPLISLAASGDGRALLRGFANASVELWNGSFDKRYRTLTGHEGWVWGVAISPSGQQLASGSFDATVRLWDAQSGAETRQFRGHKTSVSRVAFDFGGRLLASRDFDGGVRLWDVASGQDRTPLSLQGGSGAEDIAFSREGHLLVLTSEESGLRLIDTATGRNLLGESQAPKHTNLVTLSGDGAQVAAGFADGSVRIWNVSTGAQVELLGHRSVVNAIEFSRSHRFVATVSTDDTLRLWDPSTGRGLWRAPVLLAHPPEILTPQGWKGLEATTPTRTDSAWRRAIESNARFASESPDSAHVCLATHDDFLELWDTRADTKVFRTAVPKLQRVVATPAGCLSLTSAGIASSYARTGEAKTLEEHAAMVGASEDALWVGGIDHILRFDLGGIPNRNWSVAGDWTALAKVGPWIAAGKRNGAIELLDLAGSGGAQPPSLAGTPSAAVERICAGPPGTLIAGFSEGSLGVWSLADGALLSSLKLQGPAVHLLFQDNRLYAATELGDSRVVDLSVLQVGYCDLLREVWEQVSVVWENGALERRAPPLQHACARK